MRQYVPSCVQAAVVSHHIACAHANPMDGTTTLGFELDHELWCRLATRLDCVLLPATKTRGTSWLSYAPDVHGTTSKLQVCGSGPTHLFDAIKTCPRLETCGLEVHVGEYCKITGCHVSATPTPFRLVDKEAADRMLRHMLKGLSGRGVPHVDIHIEVTQTAFLCNPKARLHDFATVARDLAFAWVARILSVDCYMDKLENVGSPMFSMTAADALVNGLDISSARFFVAGMVSCSSLQLAIPWHFVAIAVT